MMLMWIFVAVFTRWVFFDREFKDPLGYAFVICFTALVYLATKEVRS